MEALTPPTARGASFGALLRRHRSEAGLTQEALAERAGISVRSIRDIERGVGRRPHRDTLTLLADALGLAPAARTAFVTLAGIRQAGSTTGSGTGRVEAMPLVGRAHELAVLDRYLAGIGPPVLALAGEPGIGKSRLLAEAVSRGRARGWSVLYGGSQRQGGQMPYAPVLEALQHAVHALRPAAARRSLQGCAWLVRLLPELADGRIEPLPGWTLTPEHEHRLMVAAVLRFLGNVAGPMGTLLVLDDLQWAGPDALDLLAMLVRAAAEVPLRVVGAYRQTEVQPRDPLGVLLADLAHGGLAAHRLLAPLAPTEAAELLDGLLEGTDDSPAATRDRVLQRAGGVPFFLVSFAQGLQSGELIGEGHEGNQAREAAPWDVAQSIRQRIAALPEGAGPVLGAAAVMGRSVQPAVLSRVMEQSEGAVLAALEAASRARLLDTVERDLQFAHDVIREVVEADLSVVRRMMLHRRIAQALEGTDGERPIQALAYHYAHTDDQAKAIFYLEQAADQAQRQFAHAVAEANYREALRHLDALDRPLEAARVREKLVPTLYLAARADQALLELEQVATTYRAAHDHEGWWRCLAQIGRMHAWRGEVAEGLARLQAVVPTLEEAAPSRGAAMLFAALAWLYLAGNQHVASIKPAERAAHMARVLGQDAILADVEARRAGALNGLGRLREARQVLEEALPVAEASGDMSALARILHNYSSVCRQQGDFDRCRRTLDRALAEADRAAMWYSMQWSLALLGELLFLQGDWSAARAQLERAVDLIRSTGFWLMSGEAIVQLARLHLAMGDQQVAASYVEDPRLWGISLTGPKIPRVLAEDDLRKGNAAAAFMRLTPPCTAGDPLGEHAVLLAWAHLELDQSGQAAELLARVIDHARAEDDRVLLVDALRIQALVYVRCRCWEAAVHTVAEGLLLARSLPYPYAEARLLHAYGWMYVKKNEAQPARERLEAALAIFRRLGAQPDCGRVEQLLATLR